MITREQLLALPVGTVILLNGGRYTLRSVNDSSNTYWVELRTSAHGYRYWPAISWVCEAGSLEATEEETTNG